MEQHDKRKSLIDEYARNARLKPAFLVILPASVLIAALGFKLSVALGILAGPLTAVGFTFLLAEMGRDFGKKKESDLFDLWGGKPSTAKLRHRDASINPHTRAGYHKTGEKLIGKKLPSVADEAADPRSADLLYEAVGDVLRELTRDQKKYPLIFSELVSYGFRRNLWGMKPIGLTIAIVAVLCQSVMISEQVIAHQPPSAFMIILLAVNVLMLVLWTAVITRSWVKTAADAYADRLLAAAL